VADVFISYKSERRAAAEHLAEILAEYGYSVWWDYGLVAGKDFSAQIEAELHSAKAVVVLWCSLSVNSEWVREEAALAKRLSKIIPVRIERVEPPLGFAMAQTLDLSMWDGAPRGPHLTRLLRDIEALTGQASKPNNEGLERIERTWRRFGAPPLHQFALSSPVELPSTPGLRPPLPKKARLAAPLWMQATAAGLVIVATAAGFGVWTWMQDPARRSNPQGQEAAASEPSHTRTWFNGDEFDDCGGQAWCPQMVVLPAGSFTMGSPEEEQGRYDTEGPRKRISIRQFGVSKFEVTFEQWDACAGRGGCRGNPEPSDQGWGRGNMPVLNVSWSDAQEYVLWLSAETGKTYRLLTEAEWEYAARGKSDEAYWWGMAASHDFANYGKDECCGGAQASHDQWMTTAPVGQFPSNPFGLNDMNGNVWEWVEDCFADSYSSLPPDGSAFKSDCAQHVARGGGWGNSPAVIRSAARYGLDSAHRDYSLGFRVGRVLN
jgi:formylglycine-generating enzyme required for sulfatase activity